MAEVPKIRVHVVELDGDVPLALYDSADRVELGIDFRKDPDAIAGALAETLQEAVDSDRWGRRGTGAHEIADQATTERAAPHPEDDPH
ncbi:hypothetical protein [Streptomyces sp.]|uniref:hypothetical protein n=1 Tax=Streptomyces sp. TaxID=1931 RepID=UPI002D778BD9|nr:hypothetical protein [Streptomyces sp.]HET6356706.1 hypothetical protein [Streptomyces sp.]